LKRDVEPEAVAIERQRGRDILDDEERKERRTRLPEVVNKSGILLSIELLGTPQQVIEAVTGLGVEGVIAKRRTSRYTPGERHTSWLKLKLDRQQEFVVGGYRPGSHGIDELLVGYYDGKNLRFAGKVRAGFKPSVRRQVHGQIAPLEIPDCPFVDLPNSKTSHWGAGVTREEMTEMRWVKPTDRLMPKRNVFRIAGEKTRYTRP
jgi:bifunctional non-homologous end joining protein LigD